MIKKTEHLGKINPNQLRTRVNLRNDSVVHKNKKKELSKKKARKPVIL